MRKLLYIFLLLPLITVQSCLKDDKEIFDKSADERMREKIAEYYKLLSSAENGWILQYYPDETRKYGGFIYLVKFTENGETTVAFERNINDGTMDSYYQINASYGPLLSFDTYNGYIHYYAEGTSDRYQAYKGDYEFMMMSHTNDVVELMGKRTDNKMRLVRMDLDTTWDEYLAEVKQTQRNAYFGMFNILLGDTEVGSATRSGRSMNFTYQPNEYVSETSTIPFVYTADGIVLYEPVKIGNVTASSFYWDNDGERFVSKDSPLEIVLQGYVGPGYALYEDFLGNWILRTTSHGTEAVVIREDQFGESYILSGAGNDSDNLDGFEWLANYEASIGGFHIYGQYVGEDLSGYMIALGIIQYPNPSTITWAEEAGIYFTRNLSETRETYTSRDNGYGAGNSLAYFNATLREMYTSPDGYSRIWGQPELIKN